VIAFLDAAGPACVPVVAAAAALSVAAIVRALRTPPRPPLAVQAARHPAGRHLARSLKES
jgi:hypothetical protein